MKPVVTAVVEVRSKCSKEKWGDWQLCHLALDDSMVEYLVQYPGVESLSEGYSDGYKYEVRLLKDRP